VLSPVDDPTLWAEPPGCDDRSSCGPSGPAGERRLQACPRATQETPRRWFEPAGRAARAGRNPVVPVSAGPGAPGL